MINRGVWRKIDKMKIPENRRLIGNKWVFKIKRDGTYRARLVALGYSQIPGVDFTDNFAPVAHDVSFRIALARMMVEKLDSLVMDVETAFVFVLWLLYFYLCCCCGCLVSLLFVVSCCCFMLLLGCCFR